MFLKNPLFCGDFAIYQAGELFCLDGEVIKPHIQICTEITYVVSGKGIVSSGNERISVSTGDVFMSLEGETHSIESDKNDPLRYCFCAFSYASQTGKDFIEKIAKEKKCVGIPAFSEYFRNLLNEIEKDDEFKYEMIGLELKKMLIVFLRSSIPDKNYGDRYRITDKSMLVYRITNYIDSNVCNIRELSDLEKVFYFKYRYLEKIFLKITGETLASYYLSAKTEYAKRKLEEGESVTDISDLLGYSSIYSFSRAFTKKVGMSPLAYKKSRMKNN